MCPNVLGLRRLVGGPTESRGDVLLHRGWSGVAGVPRLKAVTQLGGADDAFGSGTSCFSNPKKSFWGATISDDVVGS